MNLFLWDIDGTLVGTAGAGLRALDLAVAELHGVEGGTRKIIAHGNTDLRIVAEIFGDHFGREPEAHETDALLACYLTHLEAQLAASERYTIFPGVARALDLLEARPDATVGLATGNVERGAELKLKRGDLWRRFAFGGYGSDAAERAGLVARAIERGERHAGRTFARERIFVIGDTPRDVAAAHANGAVALGVATGPYARAALVDSGADVAFETLDEFPAWLAAL